MLSIESEISTASIEKLYKRLSAQREKNYIDLSLPLNPKFIGFGALSSLLQFLISWRRTKNCGRLIIGTKDHDISQENIQASVKQYYGFIASVLAWDKGIINKNGKDLKPYFRIANAQISEPLLNNLFEQAARGDSILFPFFDHLPSERGLLPSIYSNGILQDENEFLNITDALIDITTKNNFTTKKNLKALTAPLNGIMYELFDNTNKWARSSWTGKILEISVRGVYGKFYKLAPENISSYSNSTGLTKYFDKIKQNNVKLDERNRFVTFMEVSIFDSGSGLVQRFEKTSLDKLRIDDEYNALLKCLQKHTTSHSEQGDVASRGLGLHRIMTLLDEKKGFIKIRSGRLLLYRDFLTHPFYGKDGSAKYWLLDWDTDGTNPIKRPQVEGTLITILIPTLITNKLHV